MALRVTPLRSLGLAGSIVYSARLTNVGHEVCSLRATPTSLQVVTPAGAEVPVGFTAPGAEGNYPPLAASDVGPGQSGTLELNAQHACSAANGAGYNAHPAVRLIVGLSSGGHLVIDEPPSPYGPYEFPCPPVEVSSLGVPAPSPTYAPSVYEGVMARLDTPSQVQRGHVLRYVVTLTNRSSHPIPLAPCPAYNEAVYPVVGRPYTQQHYDLNCAAVSQLLPGKPVRFEMLLPIPPDFPTGPMELSWGSDVIPSPSNPSIPPGAGGVNGNLVITKR